MIHQSFMLGQSGWQRVRRHNNLTYADDTQLYISAEPGKLLTALDNQTMEQRYFFSKAKENKAEAFQTFGPGGQQRCTSQVFWISGFLEQIRCYQ